MYVLRSDFTPENIVNKLKTVDGIGSGLNCNFIQNKSIDDLVLSTKNFQIMSLRECLAQIENYYVIKFISPDFAFFNKLFLEGLWTELFFLGTYNQYLYLILFGSSYPICIKIDLQTFSIAQNNFNFLSWSVPYALHAPFAYRIENTVFSGFPTYHQFLVIDLVNETLSTQDFPSCLSQATSVNITTTSSLAKIFQINNSELIVLYKIYLEYTNQSHAYSKYNQFSNIFEYRLSKINLTTNTLEHCTFLPFSYNPTHCCVYPLIFVANDFVWCLSPYECLKFNMSLELISRHSINFPFSTPLTLYYTPPLKIEDNKVFFISNFCFCVFDLITLKGVCVPLDLSNITDRYASPDYNRVCFYMHENFMYLKKYNDPNLYRTILPTLDDYVIVTPK